MRKMSRHVSIYFFLSGGSRSSHQPRTLPAGVLWQWFLHHLHFGFFDYLHLRFAMMAQAVIPCDLALRRRVEAVEVLILSLLFLESRGSYGHIYACP